MVLAYGAREHGRTGGLWYRISVPARPNGQIGWVRPVALAEVVQAHSCPSVKMPA